MNRNDDAKRAAKWIMVAALVTHLGCSGESDPAKPAAGPALTSPSGSPLTHDVIPYRAKDAKPSIDEPRFAKAADVKLVAGTMVLGVAIGNEAKAYPFSILNQHQVVNDTCGGKSIACSW